MLRPYRYPEEPAPRGLAGQELGTLGREETACDETLHFITKYVDFV